MSWTWSMPWSWMSAMVEVWIPASWRLVAPPPLVIVLVLAFVLVLATLVLLLLLLLLLLAIVSVDTVRNVWRIRRLRAHYAAQGVPCVREDYPVVGTLPMFRRYGREGRELEFFVDLAAQYGLIHFSSLGALSRLHVLDADYIALLLRSPTYRTFTKPVFTRGILAGMIGEKNLLLSEGELHDRHRRLIAPAFHQSNVLSMVPVMAEHVSEFVQRWLTQLNEVATKSKEAAKSNEASATATATATAAIPTLHNADLHHAVCMLTLRIVVGAVFGSNLDEFGPIDTIVYDGFCEILRLIQWRFLNFVNFIPLVRDLPAFGKPEMERAQARIDDLTRRIIEQRRLGRSASKCQGNDLLELLLRAHKDNLADGLTDEEVMHEALTFVLAGHETTSGLLTFALYTLMTREDVLRACREEVDRVMISTTEATAEAPAEPATKATSTTPAAAATPHVVMPTTDQLVQMKVIEAVLHETLRLYPPAPFVPRQAPNGGTLAPEGRPPIELDPHSSIVISTYTLHRLKQYWGDNANAFDHTRWLTGTRPYSHPFAYIPFSSGPRVCIGNQFAMLEAKLALSAIVRYFDLQLVDGQKFEPHTVITLRLKHGLHAHVRARQDV